MSSRAFVCRGRVRMFAGGIAMLDRAQVSVVTSAAVLAKPNGEEPVVLMNCFLSGSSGE